MANLPMPHERLVSGPPRSLAKPPNQCMYWLWEAFPDVKAFTIYVACNDLNCPATIETALATQGFDKPDEETLRFYCHPPEASFYVRWWDTIFSVAWEVVQRYSAKAWDTFAPWYHAYYETPLLRWAVRSVAVGFFYTWYTLDNMLVLTFVLGYAVISLCELVIAWILWAKAYIVK